MRCREGIAGVAGIEKERVREGRRPAGSKGAAVAMVEGRLGGRREGKVAAVLLGAGWRLLPARLLPAASRKER